MLLVKIIFLQSKIWFKCPMAKSANVKDVRKTKARFLLANQNILNLQNSIDWGRENIFKLNLSKYTSKNTLTNWKKKPTKLTFIVIVFKMQVLMKCIPRLRLLTFDHHSPTPISSHARGSLEIPIIFTILILWVFYLSCFRAELEYIQFYEKWVYPAKDVFSFVSSKNVVTCSALSGFSVHFGTIWS